MLDVKISGQDIEDDVVINLRTQLQRIGKKYEKKQNESIAMKEEMKQKEVLIRKQLEE